jgi:hypothetical protein
MDKGKAHAILNQVKMGFYFSQEKINEALYTTGDLNVLSIAPTACKALCSDGNESPYIRTSSLESAGIGEGYKWSVDWNRRRDSFKNN